MTTEIIPAAQTLPAAVTPMDMIDKALASGASPEALEKLLALQERWEANQARKAFIVAMAQARSKFGPILKRHDGYSSRYKYETLPDVMAAVDGPLGENGFSYDWKTEDLADGRIRVTCVVTHEAGHSRSNSLAGHPNDTADAKANMNGLQRMGGAVTYLQRYTLKAALGIAAEKDSDGAAAGSPELAMTITAEQFQELRDMLDQTKDDESKMLAFVNARSMEEMTLAQYAKAKAVLVKKIDKMKKDAA